jgi:hypothetical protein
VTTSLPGSTQTVPLQPVFTQSPPGEGTCEPIGGLSSDFGFGVDEPHAINSAAKSA